MTDGPDFQGLLSRTRDAGLVAAVAVALCYLFVDRPVATWVHERRISDHAELRWLTEPPPVVQAWAPLAIAAVMVRRAWGPFHRWERAVLAAGTGLIVADQFRESLAFVFGRYWPETWVNDNPSYIKDGAYGFHFFHGGTAYGSFPSGHEARTAAVAAVVCVAVPRWRWAAAIACLAMAAGLVGMNYHFVGDVIAGGYAGAVVGAYAAYLAGLGRSHPGPQA